MADVMGPSVREQTALVTGASSGIGEELAKLAAADGCNLVLVARRQERLDALARDLSVAHGVSARVITADLANRAAPRRIAEELTKGRLTIDILVNNAGLGIYGPFWERELGKELEVVQVNVVALTELTGLLLPGMISRKRGRILNVASTAAFQPGPWMAVYYATKAYVLSFSEAIAEELKGTGVTVTALCPGPTITEFQGAAGVRHRASSRRFRHGRAEGRPRRLGRRQTGQARRHPRPLQQAPQGSRPLLPAPSRHRRRRPPPEETGRKSANRRRLD